MNATSDLFGLLKLDEPIQIMDVGASAINEVPVYKVLLDQGIAHLHAFEGDERQIASIERAYGAQATIHKDFLFDGTEQTLYVAQSESGMTSLLEPRPEALHFFNGFPEFGKIIATERVQTARMDDIAALPWIDLLKMDIQGAELTVLRNGVGKLAQCLVVQLEVSWIPLYREQPSFGEVDVWMRAQGFAPHCLLDVKRWSIAPTIFAGDFRKPGNQLLESDIVYIRDPLRLDLIEDLQLVKLALIAHNALNSPDLCVHALRELAARGVVEPEAQEHYYRNLR